MTARCSPEESRGSDVAGLDGRKGGEGRGRGREEGDGGKDGEVEGRKGRSKGGRREGDGGVEGRTVG